MDCMAVYGICRVLSTRRFGCPLGARPLNVGGWLWCSVCALRRTTSLWSRGGLLTDGGVSTTTGRLTGICPCSGTNGIVYLTGVRADHREADLRVVATPMGVWGGFMLCVGIPAPVMMVPTVPCWNLSGIDKGLVSRLAT